VRESTIPCEGTKTSKGELLPFLGDFDHYGFVRKAFVLKEVISQPAMSWRFQLRRK
jgi:hypothetical protein